MAAASIAVLGGSGFVGRSLVARLCAEGRRVRVLTRDPLVARHLLVLPTVEIAHADPHDEHELPRLLQMSALGASEEAPSAYLRSRARGEGAVREAAGSTAVTFFRPSVIFGPHDRFLNLFSRLTGLFPVIPLAGASARFQPGWVEDVAHARGACLDDAGTYGATYELGGPRVYTLSEILAFVIHLRHVTRVVVELPDWVARLQATVFEVLPGPIMTRDNLLSMSVPNVCAGPFPDVLGFEPSSMEAIVPRYLDASRPMGRFDDYRYRAGR